MTAAFDPIAMLEAGYVQYEDRVGWMHAMTEIVTRSFDPDAMGAICYFLGPEGPTSGRRFFPSENTPQGGYDGVLEQGVAVMSQEGVARLVRTLMRPGLMSMVEALGALPDTAATRKWGGRDSVGVAVHCGEGPPAVFGTLTRNEYRIDASARALWRRIAIHLGAGLRLSGRGASPEAPDVECVITPGGRVAHAQGRGQDNAARERLRVAVREVDRARTRKGRADPEAALEMWRGLFSGRWSLVDHFDTDGRRFLLARRNDPNTPGPPALPLRQRQILFCVGAGWGNKEVGYALGVSETTVATHLSRALRAINVPSRSEWIRISTELALEQMRHDSQPAADER